MATNPWNEDDGNEEALDGEIFSSANDCEAAVREVRRNPTKLLLVCLVKLGDEDGDRVKDLIRAWGKLRKDQRFENKHAFLLIHEKQPHAKFFKETFQVNVDTGCFVLRSDGTVVDKVVSHRPGRNVDIGMLKDFEHAVLNSAKKLEEQLLTLMLQQREHKKNVNPKSEPKKQPRVLERDEDGDGEPGPKDYVEQQKDGLGHPTTETLSLENARIKNADEWVATKPVPPSARLLAQEVSNESKEEYDTGERIMLGIRLFNGSKLVSKFPKTLKLEEVYKYIDENRHDDGSPYVLVQVYPRREFDESHMLQTLEILGINSSTLLALEPLKRETSGTINLLGNSESFLAFLLAMLTSLWTTIVGMLPFKSTSNRTESFQSEQGRRIPPQSQGTTHGNRNLRQRRTGTLHELDRDNENDRNEYFGGDSTVFQGPPSNDSL